MTINKADKLKNNEECEVINVTNKFYIQVCPEAPKSLILV